MNSTAEHELPENTARPVRQRSKLALLSLLLSVVPPACLFAPFMGAVALARIRRDPTLEGRPLAWAGIAVGTVVTSAILISTWVAFRQIQFITTESPAIAMRAAMAGDGAGFREQLTGPGNRATPTELVAWSHEMQERFGAFKNLEIATTAPRSTLTPDERGDQMMLAYVFTFERARVPATVLFAVPEGARSGLFQARIRRITLEPTEGTRIVFPDEH